MNTIFQREGGEGRGGWVGTECRKSCNLLGVMWLFFFL